MNTNSQDTKVKLLTIKQAAEVIEGLTEYRIRQLCHAGDLPSIKAGKKYLINEQTLINIISVMDKQNRRETSE